MPKVIINYGMDSFRYSLDGVNKLSARVEKIRDTWICTVDDEDLEHPLIEIYTKDVEMAQKIAESVLIAEYTKEVSTCYENPEISQIISQTDWRTCPKCGVDWPHPSVTSGMTCPRCILSYDKAREIIQTWLDKQGHERCWYYPDLFKELATLYGIKPKVEPKLPPLEEFKIGCERHQKEEYFDEG